METSIQIISDSSLKMVIMKECDSAFTRSVCKRKDFPELFRKIDQYAIFIGMTVESKIVGYAALYANDEVEQKAFLTLFCVKTDMHRKHLGSTLMEACFSEAKKRQMKVMDLEVLQIDEGPRHFYHHVGFYEIEKETDQFVRMRKNL